MRRAPSTSALLAERHELRGRLDAYTPRPAGSATLEDPGLEAAATPGRTTLLYTAPTDLAVGRRAVRQYQAALSALAGEGSRAR